MTRNLLRDRRGASMAEYVLMTAAVLMISAGSWRVLGNRIAGRSTDRAATTLATSAPVNGGGTSRGPTASGIGGSSVTPGTPSTPASRRTALRQQIAEAQRAVAAARTPKDKELAAKRLATLQAELTSLEAQS